MPSQKEEPKKKRRRRSNAGCIPLPPRPINTFKVGVYFPDRDLLNFEVKSHEFSLSPKGDGAFFYNVLEGGFKEFVGRFTHVAYILITETKQEGRECKGHVSADDLPKDFGKLQLV